MAEYEPTTISKEYAAYIRSGVWKCTKSPTGAHHWIEAKVDGAKPGTFVCKYCWENRIFQLSAYEKEKKHGRGKRKIKGIELLDMPELQG